MQRKAATLLSRDLGVGTVSLERDLRSGLRLAIVTGGKAADRQPFFREK